MQQLHSHSTTAKEWWSGCLPDAGWQAYEHMVQSERPGSPDVEAMIFVREFFEACANWETVVAERHAAEGQLRSPTDSKK